MIFCCEDHVELALDVIVDDYFVAPKLEKLESTGKEATGCEYCGKPAVYMVANG